MEGSSTRSTNIPADKRELETLQNQHEEKILRIQELRKQIESTKLRLEEKKKNKKKVMEEIPEERKQCFKNLCEEYNFTREEYNALVAEKSKEEDSANK